VKISHVAFSILSLVFGIVGFIALLQAKNLAKSPHFMTCPSWLMA
jgi:hypothetical protein